MAPADDHLAPLTPAKVAEWYGRLADLMAKKKVRSKEPLAAIFLKQYLVNRDKDSVFRFEAPTYLREYAGVIDALKYHRAVFFTEKRARIGKSEKWAGVVPRLQDGRWNIRFGPLEMHYHSLVEVGGSMLEMLRIRRSGTAEEKDLFASLRGFQLRSDIVVLGAPEPPGKVWVMPMLWKARVFDRYDFDYKEHLTLPNPDYKSTASDAVRPKDRKLRVYHRNAERMVKAGLAAPYDLESHSWLVVDKAVFRNSAVDPRRKLKSRIDEFLGK